MHEGHPGAAARLTALYETYATDAFRYALHITGRREDAEDVVQFVFLRAYGMLDAGTELVNPRAWLLKATKHRSLNMLRARREAPMADTDLPVGPQYDPDPAEAEALADVRLDACGRFRRASITRSSCGTGAGSPRTRSPTSSAPRPAPSNHCSSGRGRALVEDREQGAECAGVRRRLVQALAPTGGQQAHIDACRRCRTAQTRLLRAAEFATAFTLVPRPHVAHALASLVPGFSAPAVAATTTATGAAGAGAGGGAGVATARRQRRLALAAKIALATTTAVVALSAAHPVRRAVEHVVLGGPAASLGSEHATAPATAPAAVRRGVPPPGTAATGQPAHGSPRAHPAHGGTGKGNGKGRARRNGKGKARARARQGTRRARQGQGEGQAGDSGSERPGPRQIGDRRRQRQGHGQALDAGIPGQGPGQDRKQGQGCGQDDGQGADRRRSERRIGAQPRRPREREEDPKS